MRSEYYDLYDIVIKEINENGYFVYGKFFEKKLKEETGLCKDDQKKALQFFERMGYFNPHEKFKKIYIRSSKLKGGC